MKLLACVLNREITCSNFNYCDLQAGPKLLGLCALLRIRVDPNRMTVFTPYPRYAVYPVPYLRFLTVYDRIWTVFAGGTPQTRVQFLAKAVSALFGPYFFSRGFLY